jgi:AraC family transcriptional regulator
MSEERFAPRKQGYAISIKRPIFSSCKSGRREDTMRPIERTVWYVESHLNLAMSLNDIARIAGLSKFALTREFRATTGHTVLAYVRARRLSEAAKSLQRGAPSILDVALSAGYGSHEAFSRAFRSHFGCTPAEVRCGCRPAPSLTEIIDMSKDDSRPPLAPRFSDHKAFQVAGLNRRFSIQDTAAIPGLWQSFGRHIGAIPGEVAGVAYGVCYNADDKSFDYLCGVEVRSSSDLPQGFIVLDVPANHYAVFHHGGHITDIHAIMRAIFSDWLPASGHQAAAAPVFERYGPEFDSRTGAGGFDIYVPLKV